VEVIKMKNIMLLIILLGIFLISINLVSSATWNSTFNNGLVENYFFNNGSDSLEKGGDFITLEGSPTYTTTGCKSGSCLSITANNNVYLNQTSDIFDMSNSSKNITINFWMDSGETESAGDCYVSYNNTDRWGVVYNSGTRLYGYNLGGDWIAMPTGQFMVTLVSTSSGNFDYINGVLVRSGELPPIATGVGRFYIGSDARATDTALLMDDMQIWSRNLSVSEILSLYDGGTGIFYDNSTSGGDTTPLINVNLTSPLNNTLISTETISFITNLTGTNIKNFSNATFYLWDPNGSIFNKTTTVILNTKNSTIQNITNLSLAVTYKWNVLSCGYNYTNDSVCSWGNSGNFSFTSSAFSENYIGYTNSVFETSNTQFTLNISGNPSINSASAVLWYNGTSYSSTVMDGTSGIYKAINNIDIPLRIAGANKTFFWEWTFILTNGNIARQNSTAYSQEVNRTYLINCNSTYSTQFVNFTTKQAVNPFPKLNATFKSAWNYWIGSGGVKRNYTYEDVTGNANNWTFCGSNVNLTYHTNTNIEYDSNGFAQNFYYLENASLTNTTNEISLFLLNDSLATITELITWDSAQNPIPNILIQIQMYDVGTDTFYTVGMGKTSFEGKDVAYLTWYSTLYKFIFIRNGEVVKTTEPYKISSTPQTFTISDAVTYSFDKFRDFVYTLTYNNITKNFILTFTKPSGLVDQGCLRVTKRSVQNDTEICLVCETSTSATIYCNIGGSGNGTFIATFYATGSWYLLDWIETTIGGTFAQTIYELLGNEDATAYAFLFSGIVISMFFLSPVLTIVGLILGILGGAALGFTILNYTAFLGIVIVGGIIIWLIKR
jgi:hypothetical protein